jgi:hypothetical protein
VALQTAYAIRRSDGSALYLGRSVGTRPAPWTDELIRARLFRTPQEARHLAELLNVRDARLVRLQIDSRPVPAGEGAAS